MMGISCDCYCGERLELADLLDKAVDLADACNFWFAGQDGSQAFAEMSLWLRARLAEEAV